ncbi:MAG TPA: methyltransferase domain-containing protein [Polyangiales bacterium]|nr:methyltransferase domain-containing protein [Polyangiales bacterium]
MGFYDVFANFYDASLEPLYVEYRALAADALSLTSSAVVLDLPCGTGQSFEVLASRVGSGGTIFGVDASAGMLQRAAARVSKCGYSNVHLVQAGAESLAAPQLAAAAGRDTQVNRLHVFLGMTVFADPDATFENLWELLAPGGICVLVDVHAERLGVQGWLVNQIARADIRRRFWEPLERVALDFERRHLPFRRQHGGQIMLARGRKP